MEGTSGAVLLGSFREQPGRAALKAVGFVPEPRRADPEKHLGDQIRAQLPSGNGSSAWSSGAIVFPDASMSERDSGVSELRTRLG